MNVESILKVADAIEQHSVPGLAFHMNYTYEDDKDEVERTQARSPDQVRMGSECGAIACLIGWTNTVIPAPFREARGDDVYARVSLGLTLKEADSLFYPDKEKWG